MPIRNYLGHFSALLPSNMMNAVHTVARQDRSVSTTFRHEGPKHQLRTARSTIESLIRNSLPGPASRAISSGNSAQQYAGNAAWSRAPSLPDYQFHRHSPHSPSWHNPSYGAGPVQQQIPRYHQAAPMPAQSALTVPRQAMPHAEGIHPAVLRASRLTFEREAFHRSQQQHALSPQNQVEEDRQLALALQNSLTEQERPQARAKAPEFYAQTTSTAFAAEAGFPTYQMCGALALAHMTGQPPHIPELYDIARNSLLTQGKTPEAAAREIASGVYLEHLTTLLSRQNIRHRVVDILPSDYSADNQSVNDQLRQQFDPGKTSGITFGYQRIEGKDTFHFAALKKTGDTWWLMDSLEKGPVNLGKSPMAFLQDRADRETGQRGVFSMITVA